MIALAGSGDITAALGSSITTLMEEPGNQNLLKLWRLQVKNMTTRITVIRRFERKYSAKSFHCGIASGLTLASPQLTSKVKRSNTSEGSKTRNQATGTLFSPNSPLQNAAKRKFNLEKKNREGFAVGDFFKDHCTLSHIQILLTLLSFQILKEADLLDEAFGGLIIVTVIALESRQEGTTATYNPVGRTVLIGLLLFICLSNFEKSGVHAQDDSEDGKREGPNERVDLLYIIQAAAWTLMIALIVGRIYRRPLVRAPAAAPPAVPPPATAPLALPEATAALPVVRPPAAAPPAVPPPAAAPPALPVAPPAVPIAMGFVNVMNGLEEDPTPARLSNPNLHISPRLEED